MKELLAKGILSPGYLEGGGFYWDIPTLIVATSF